MDRLHLMSVYVAVVEAGGFAGGARRLQLSPPAVTRAIAALEERLGVKLLNRTTRHVRMTEAGHKYYEDARHIISLADEADDAVLGINAEPRGQLTVTASVLFGRLHVLPGIIDYLHRYPEVEVNALFVDRVVNMLEEGVDVAVRIGELPDSSYRALRVGEVRRELFASPDYLAKYGTPRTPDDLVNHRIILARGITPANEFRFSVNGAPYLVKFKPQLCVSDNDSAATAAIAGLGITRLLSYQVADALATGKLQRVLGEFNIPAVPVHILHREGRLSSAKIRSFVDLLAERLRGQLTPC